MLRAAVRIFCTMSVLLPAHKNEPSLARFTDDDRPKGHGTAVVVNQGQARLAAERLPARGGS